MEPKHYTQSVIAKLMGLDDMPRQKPVHTRKRVLSENYLRKTASIGLQEKRPINRGHLFTINTEKVRELEEVFGLSGIMKKEKAKSSINEEDIAFLHQSFEDAKRLSVSEKLQQSKAFNKGNHRKIEKATTSGNILRSCQKLDNGFEAEPYIAHALPTKIVILKPNSNKLTGTFKSSLSCNSQPGNSKESSSSNIVELHTKLRKSGTLQNSFEPSGHKFRVSKNSVKEKETIIPKARSRISIFSSNVSNAEVKVDETSENEPEVLISSSNYSTFAREAKERLSERWKMTKVAQGSGTSSCGATLSEMLSLPGLDVGPETLNERNEGNLEENLEENMNNASTTNSSNLASAFSVKDVMADAEIKNVGLTTGDGTKQQSLSMASDMFGKDGHSQCFFDDSSGQESKIGSHEYVVDYSNCISSGEAYQPSPNSVLKPPFKEDGSPVSHCYETLSTADLQGLWTQLQLLKSDCEESQSEGTQMVFSSDENSTEKSFHLSNKNARLIKFLQEQESRDFSYLLDILDESGLHGGVTLVSLDSWHSPECLLNPLVFESLEKKYSDDHMSWNKEQRRLLFDRVNGGLMQILKPWLDVHIYAKPLRKMVGNASIRDVIEEELWSLLVSEEKEVKKELSEKAVGSESWVEFSDEVEAIAIDLENFLFNELVNQYLECS